jgi:hypothetical protein
MGDERRVEVELDVKEMKRTTGREQRRERDERETMQKSDWEECTVCA